MRFWRILYEAIVVLIIMSISKFVIDVPYLDFVIGIFGILAFELYGNLIENKKI